MLEWLLVADWPGDEYNLLFIIHCSASATAENSSGAEHRPKGNTESMYTLPSQDMPKPALSEGWTGMLR